MKYSRYSADQLLHKQVISCFSRKPINIVNLLVSAHIEIPITDLVSGSITKGLTRVQFIHYTLHYALIDNDMLKAFRNLMPCEFTCQFPDLFKDHAPNLKLCKDMASVIVTYKDIDFIIEKVLEHVNTEYPEIGREISILDL